MDVDDDKHIKKNDKIQEQDLNGFLVWLHSNSKNVLRSLFYIKAILLFNLYFSVLFIGAKFLMDDPDIDFSKVPLYYFILIVIIVIVNYFIKKLKKIDSISKNKVQ